MASQKINVGRIAPRIIIVLPSAVTVRQGRGRGKKSELSDAFGGDHGRGSVVEPGGRTRWCPAPPPGELAWGSRSGLPLPLPQSILLLSVRTKRLLTKSPANRVPSGFRDPASLATMTGGSPNLTPCSVMCLTLRSARHSFHAVDDD